MKELTQAQFLNALDGQAVAIAWHHDFSSHNKGAVDEAARRWHSNLDTLFYAMDTLFYRATKMNSHSFHLGNYRPNIVSVHGFRCYRAKSGWLYMIRQSSCHNGGVLFYTVEAYLFAVNS